MNIKKLFHIILTILCALFIIWNSSKPASISNQYSKGITQAIISLTIPSFNEMTKTEQYNIIAKIHTTIRKIAHFIEYGILGALSTTLLTHLNFTKRKKLNNTKIFLITTAFCTLFAISDEIHQIFVDGRAFQITDICIDAAGSLTGAIITLFLTVRTFPIIPHGEDISDYSSR